MNWLVWDNPRSGNRTTKAHLADSFTSGVRTYCGAVIGDGNMPASSRIPRCQLCQFAAKRKETEKHGTAGLFEGSGQRR